MTKVTFVSAVLIAAALLTTQAMARSSDAAARRAASKTHAVTDCVRAPNIGAYASAPYKVPPCIGSAIN